MDNELRNGRITSSNIYKIANGYRPGGKNIFLKPALTYIDELIMERELKRSLDGGAFSQPIKWGLYMENRLFQKLGLEWQMTSRDTLTHPDEEFAPYWAGTPDVKNDEMVGEIKCFQLKHFCQIVRVFNKHNKGLLSKDETIEVLKDQESEIYWQTVSNAILLGVKTAQMIIYAPCESEMDEVRKDITNYEGADQWHYRFIVEKENHELAVLPDDCIYDPINIFEFEIPAQDKTFVFYHYPIG
jgi:hypothetical protein